jgi:hypothetical protein
VSQIAEVVIRTEDGRKLVLSGKEARSLFAKRRKIPLRLQAMLDTSDTDPPPPTPAGYEGDLSAYSPVFYDNGEPIGWGFAILRYLDNDRFNGLGTFGELACLSMGKWAVVVKWLTEEEAIHRYGPISRVELGPQGGWRSVGYGKTTFYSKRLRPVAYGGPAR